MLTQPSLAGNVRRYVVLPQSRGGTRFCTRGAMQGYDVVLFVLALAKTVTPAGVPGGAGAGRTADHLAFFFSQKVLAVRSANDIYRPVRQRKLFCNIKLFQIFSSKHCLSRGNLVVMR